MLGCSCLPSGTDHPQLSDLQNTDSLVFTNLYIEKPATKDFGEDAANTRMSPEHEFKDLKEHILTMIVCSTITPIDNL